MAAMAPRPTPPGARRPGAITTAPSPVPRNGATARSALSPRMSAMKSPTRSYSRDSSPVLGDDSPEDLRREIEHKEQLLVQLNNKEQTINDLTTENDHLSSALNSAEGRLAELYADQGRMEDELATRIEIVEKLRTQSHEAERELREMQRRYKEQTSTFEAERQAFYDNEQHLKSRIQSLTQSLSQARQPQFAPAPSRDADMASIADTVSIAPSVSFPSEAKAPTPPEPEKESPEMISLRLELATLTTSYSSIQNTLLLLQSQLNDVKRVNNLLQEDNESYMILLREKTLSGQFDIMRMGGNSGSDEDDEDVAGSISDSIHSSARSTPLDVVDETEEEYNASRASELDPEFQQDLEEAASAGESLDALSPPPRGESLAGLPLTGPGLDLAAELGRAEVKDLGMTTGPTSYETGSPKRKRNRKSMPAAPTGRKVTSLASEMADSSTKSDLATLRNEVKSLKDANKALSLYASRIIDRIIAQDGFEHVLSVDYEKSPTTPSAANFNPPKPAPAQKLRPQSFFGFGSASKDAPLSPPIGPGEKLTTFDSIRPAAPPAPPPKAAPAPSSAAAAAAKRADNRRSFSLDWSSFSLFNKNGTGPASTNASPNPNLKPLTLGSSPAAPVARKLDTTEDEDDRRERERLQATMKLMGIERPPADPVPLIKSYSSPADDSLRPRANTMVSARPPLLSTHSTEAASKASSRWSLFRSRSTRTPASEGASPAASGSGTPNPPELTHAALEHAEVEEKLAALDADERMLSEQIAKGGSSGFTEIQPRSSRRSRKSAGGSGSGSTVWSAGMSKDGHGDE